MSPYAYLDYCPQCGSERGPGGHECIDNLAELSVDSRVLPLSETPFVEPAPTTEPVIEEPPLTPTESRERQRDIEEASPGFWWRLKHENDY